MGLIKAQNYNGRQEFNKVWKAMTARVHMEMLAKPTPRRMEPDPNPEYYKPFPIKIPEATLSHNPSKRLILLSRVPHGKFSEKYTPQPPPEHYVQPYNLYFVPSPRLKALSQPRGREKKKKKKKKPKHSKKGSIDKSSKKKSHHSALYSREQWLAQRAQPKKLPPQPSIPKWKRRTEPLSPEERETRIAELSQPTSRYLYKPPPWDPYEVSKFAQKAKPTKRIIELAEHRELPEEAQLDLAYKPFTINKNALRYKATKRIIDLSEPFAHLKRKAQELVKDLKEDAFSVPRRALKAKCTQRTKELARPVTRPTID